MTVHLLDANVLIALSVREHEHHERATAWLAGIETFAVSPVVEGSLIRFLTRLGESPRTVTSLLSALHHHPRSRFWPDDRSYADVDLSSVRGHRQVTDTYLASLAESQGGILATFDGSLAQRYPGTTLLIP